MRKVVASIKSRKVSNVNGSEVQRYKKKRKKKKRVGIKKEARFSIYI